MVVEGEEEEEEEENEGEEEEGDGEEGEEEREEEGEGEEEVNSVHDTVTIYPIMQLFLFYSSLTVEWRR